MIRDLKYVLFFLALLMLSACNNGDKGLIGGPELEVDVIALQVTPAKVYIAAGLSQQYKAIAIKSNGSTKDVTTHHSLSWSSSDTTIATIDIETGLVTSVMSGKVTITASGMVNGVELNQTAILTVTDATVVPGGVVVTSDAEYMASGFSMEFTATATLSDGTTYTGLGDGSEGHWTIVSQPGTKASIDTNTGILRTNEVDSVGEITVQFKGTSAAWGGTAEKTITVTDATVLGVVVTSDTEHIASGFSIAFTATATLSDGTTYTDLGDGSEGNWTIVSQTGTKASIDTNTGILRTTEVDSVGEITVQFKGTSAAWGGTAEKTITVTDATVLGVVVTSDVGNVTIAGFSVGLTATVTFSDDSTHIVTQDGSEARWLIPPFPNAAFYHIDTNTGVLTTTANSAGILLQVQVVVVSGNNNYYGSFGMTVMDAVVTSVTVTSDEDNVVAGLSLDFSAIANLSNDTDVGVGDGLNGDWSIVSQPGKNATIDTKTGVLTTGLDSVGDITVQLKGTSEAWRGTANKTITVNDAL
ncbi:Ig domain protein, group 2 domain protein [Psychromonas sp. CNPT3]|uniref:Ig-like domain-containing protein n=1 Tax=Psychromonas sp. CNPT3 TaxID=314282 RepID=UPI00006E48C1|nr:Ig-like domain-containing protein [Psychromonas sp. CNPT3]AGH80959.1 Ig domain protein, group 2 domain protein [Psychromonas sp. CNPT3]